MHKHALSTLAAPLLAAALLVVPASSPAGAAVHWGHTDCYNARSGAFIATQPTPTPPEICVLADYGPQPGGGLNLYSIEIDVFASGTDSHFQTPALTGDSISFQWPGGASVWGYGPMRTFSGGESGPNNPDQFQTVTYDFGNSPKQVGSSSGNIVIKAPVMHFLKSTVGLQTISSTIS